MKSEAAVSLPVKHQIPQISSFTSSCVDIHRPPATDFLCRVNSMRELQSRRHQRRPVRKMKLRSPPEVSEDFTPRRVFDVRVEECSQDSPGGLAAA